MRAILALLAAAAAVGCTTAGRQDGGMAGPPASAGEARRPACDADNGGITLPPGFCALVVADSLGPVRHIAVSPGGDLYAAVMGRRGGGGGVLALRDTRDGRADVRQAFGGEALSGGGGTGIQIHDGWLYFAPNASVVRWRLAPGRLVPAGAPEVLVRDLPTGGHTAKTIAVDPRGNLFVNVGSRTNSCQQADRQTRSPGTDPCTELETRAGIWRFDASRAGQTQAGGERFATGIRNAVAIQVGPDGELYAAQHGRDQLAQSWGFTERQSAENPAEELIRVTRGDDFGWPYCYHSVDVGRKVLAPEYGGDGTQVGRCAGVEPALVAFPGHWAPEAIAFYTGAQFPERYRGGAFISFHGSWNRAPLPQAGYNVAFVPMRGGSPAGDYEVFADGFAGASPSPSSGRRPMGLAVGPDGSLYVSDDAGGRIWRIVYTGGR